MHMHDTIITPSAYRMEITEESPLFGERVVTTNDAIPKFPMPLLQSTRLTTLHMIIPIYRYARVKRMPMHPSQPSLDGVCVHPLDAV